MARDRVLTQYTDKPIVSNNGILDIAICCRLAFQEGEAFWVSEDGCLLAQELISELLQIKGPSDQSIPVTPTAHHEGWKLFAHSDGISDSGGIAGIRPTDSVIQTR